MACTSGMSRARASCSASTRLVALSTGRRSSVRQTPLMNAAEARKPESTGSPRRAPWHSTTESSNPDSPTSPTSSATDAAYSSSCIRARQSRPACFCDVRSQRRIRSMSPVCSADHAVASESQRSEATSRSDSPPSQVRRRSGRPDPRQPSMPDHMSSASSGRSPACLAWRTAASRSPCDWNQRAARWWSTGTTVGSSAARSVASCSASRWWQRNRLSPSSLTTSRLCWCRWARTVAESRRSSTASHAPGVSSSSTLVRSRN